MERVFFGLICLISRQTLWRRKEGRKEERKVEYSMYVSDLINASCNVTRCSFTSGKKIVTKPRLRADSSRLYLPIMFRFC